mgnify:CR=1 FL=1
MAEEPEPKLEDVVSEVEGSNIPVPNKEPDFYEELEQEGGVTESLIDTENREIIRMRRQWSSAILFLIYLIVVLGFVLVAMYGWGGWKFDNPYVVVVVITDNFLKIIGLGFLITKSVFTKIFPYINAPNSGKN